MKIKTYNLKTLEWDEVIDIDQTIVIEDDYRNIIKIYPKTRNTHLGKIQTFSISAPIGSLFILSQSANNIELHIDKD